MVFRMRGFNQMILYTMPAHRFAQVRGDDIVILYDMAAHRIMLMSGGNINKLICSESVQS